MCVVVVAFVFLLMSGLCVCCYWLVFSIVVVFAFVVIWVVLVVVGLWLLRCGVCVCCRWCVFVVVV